MYHAILGAKHTIFITDWRLTGMSELNVHSSVLFGSVVYNEERESPGEVYLMRQTPFEDCHRVDQLLKKKAEQGVRSHSSRVTRVWPMH